MEAVSQPARSSSQFNATMFAQQAIRLEAQALLKLADEVGDDFMQAIETLATCRGAVVVTGIGKAGLVGQKLSATLSSTGTRSHFLHPAEAIHGDLGRLSQDDHILALSMSGETEELVKVLPSLKLLTTKIVSITGSTNNTLARSSDVVMEIGPVIEADTNGLVPSTSTTVMLALGDALALTLSELRGFRSHDFVRFHPGGSLGRKLTRVEQMMRPVEECRVVHGSQTVRESFMTRRGQGRRTGVVMIVDDQSKMTGVFTDSDLARLLENESESTGDSSLLDQPVENVMTRNPYTIAVEAMMPSAIEILAENQISELPVLNSDGQPVGLVDITDVIGWIPSFDSRTSETVAECVIETEQTKLNYSPHLPNGDDSPDEGEPTLLPFPEIDSQVSNPAKREKP